MLTGKAIMNSLINKIKYEFREPIPKFGAIILIVGGLIMGTVFIFGMYYWEGSVPKSEAIFVKATYASYTEEYMRRGSSYFELYFEDHKRLDIDTVCCSDEVSQYVYSLKPGTILNLYIHPRSNTILELIDNGNVIIGYDETIKKLSSEVKAFRVLGLILYSWAVLSIIKIIRKETI